MIYDLEPYDDDRRLDELRAVQPDLMKRLRLAEVHYEQMTPAQARASYSGPRFPFLFGNDDDDDKPSDDNPR